MLEKVKQVFGRAQSENRMAFIKVSLPGQIEPEIIVNYPSSLQNKLAYYEKAYNEDGTLKTNPNIKIIEAGMVTDGLEVESL